MQVVLGGEGRGRNGVRAHTKKKGLNCSRGNGKERHESV